MRVGDCESYAKIINWINCELELHRTNAFTTSVVT